MDNPNEGPMVLFVGYDPESAVGRLDTEQQIDSVSTLADARGRVRTDKVDAVVSEYTLRDGTGIELVRTIRDEQPGLPVILWTAEGNEAVASEAVTAGVTEYVVKDEETLTEQVNEILGQVEGFVENHNSRPDELPMNIEGELSRQLLENCPVGITAFDADGQISYANNRAADILKMSPDDLTNPVFDDSDWEVIDSDGDRVPVDGLPSRRVQATGEAIYRRELGIRPQDGAETWLLVNAVPVPAPSAGGPCVVTAFDDITERKRQNAALEASERKFHAVFEEAFDAMLIADDNTEYVDVNQAACELFGLPREDLLGRSIAEFSAEGYDFRTAWRDFQRSDEDHGYFPLVTADGEQRLVEFAATPDILPGRHLSVIRDVTEQQRIEQELAEIFDRITDAVHGLDDEWCFTYLNDRAEELLGRTEEELRGKYVWDEFPDALERTYRERYEQAMETQQPVVFEEYSDAADAWLEVTAYPSETGLSVYFHDITNRKQREQQLQMYETIVQTVDDGIFVADDDDRFRMVNNALCEMTGYERDDLRGRSTTLIYSDEIALDADQIDERGISDTRDVGTIELDIDAKDGTQFPAEGRFQPFPLDEGHGRCGVLRDISKRKEREAELQLFRDLVDHSSDAINVIDPDSAEVIEANETSCRMLGYSRSALLSLTVPDFNPEFSMEMWDGFVDSVEEDGETVIESIHERKAGGTFPVEIKIQHVTLDSDYLVAAVRDISARKEQERELEASKEKFRSLIETAPDPIFIADADTGEIVETNSAASSIRKQSRDEIIGLQQTELHPEDESGRYRELFERQITEGGTVKRFDDSTPIYLTTSDGEYIPVAISCRSVTLGDRTLIHGIFRDVSDQVRYEETLRDLNRAACGFLGAETDYEIAQQTVDVASDVLDLSGVAVYLYNDERGVLSPAAFTSDFDDFPDEVPSFSPGNSITWRVFAEQQQARYADVRSEDDLYNPGTPIRSALFVPLGQHGVFVAGDTEIGVFDDLTVELTEVLIATAEVALERIDWAQELREQKQESQLQAKRLERVSRINDKIRSIIHAVVDAETPAEIEQAVCTFLSDIDQFEFAWIGHSDPTSGKITPETWSGSNPQYLETLSLHYDAETGEPTVKTAREQEPTIVSNIADALQTDSWRRNALQHDFLSAISVPLIHDGLLYGVLTIYGNRPAVFDERSKSVLTELGELIGYALDAIEQRAAMFGSDIVELTFRQTETGGTFVRLAAQLGVEIEIKSISSRFDGSYLVYLEVHDIDPQQFSKEARQYSIIDEVCLISDSESSVFEVIVSGPCIVTSITDVPAVPHGIRITEQGRQVTVSVPQDRNVRAFIERFRDQYPDTTLVGRQDSQRTDSSLQLSSLLDHLSTRQQEVLKSAYYGGFFEQPRKSTGADIAESLGISQPAFSKQLRKSERNLLEPLFDPW